VPTLLVGIAPGLAAKLPADSGVARFLLTAFAANPGEITGLLPTVLMAGLATAPLAAALGAQFVLVSRLYGLQCEQDGGHLARVYVGEALGAFVGAGALSFAVVTALNPFLLAALVAAALAGSASDLARREQAPSSGVLGIGIAVFVAALVAARPIENSSLRLRWRGFEVVASARSVYGQLTVTREGSLHSVYANGLCLFTTPVPQLCEEVVNYPLLAHPGPRRVLLVGAGVGGALQQVLAHGPQQVDYVELDPKLVRLTRPFLHEADQQALDDPRVRLHLTDGRRFIQQQGARGVTYDVVLLVIPDPSTAQLNRFYTAEFYREVARVLAPQGLLGFGLSSSEGYFSPPLLAFNACVLRTLRTAFRAATLVPGDHASILAAQSPGVLRLDPDLFGQRMDRRHVWSESLGSMLHYKLDAARRAMVLQTLRDAPPTPLNTDLRPVCYYYDQMLWTTWFHPGARAWFERAAQATPLRALLWVGGALALLSLLAARLRPRHWDLCAAVATTGLAGISLEFVLLLVFQTLYGSVYHKIGLLVGSFMLGLALGAVVATRWAERRPPSKLWAAVVGTAIAALAGGLPAILSGLRALAERGCSEAVGQLLFALLTGLIGALVGAVYAPAIRCLRESGVEPGRASGTIYAADLLGACLGAGVTSIVLAPILGLVVTSGLVGALNGFAALILCLAALRRVGPSA